MVLLLASCASDGPKKTVRRKIKRKRSQAKVVQLEQVTPTSLGYDLKALDDLLGDLQDTKEGTFAIMANGSLVSSHQAPTASLDAAVRLDGMSLLLWTLAVGALVDDGKLSWDTKLSALFDFTEGKPQGDITVGHVVNERTGLRRIRPHDVGDDQDVVEAMLSAPVEIKPGSRRHSYGMSMLLLPAMVEEATDGSFEDYVADRLAAPLGLQSMRIEEGRMGEPVVWANTLDVARMGQLLARGGKAIGGERLLQLDTVQRLVRPRRGKPSSLASWRGIYPARQVALSKPGMRFLRLRGLDEEEVDEMKPLVGKFVQPEEFAPLLEDTLGEARAEEVFAWAKKHDVTLTEVERGKPIGVVLQDGRGQMLAVYPKSKTSVVRLTMKPAAVPQMLDRLSTVLPARKTP